jgi:O-6-methylguanine DNA methyltransferase
MAEIDYTLFDTALGSCVIAWSDAGVVALQLPEASIMKSRERICRRFPLVCETVPASQIRRAILQLCALLVGEESDLTGIALDMRGIPEFYRRVYALTRRVHVGDTTTYGKLAEQLGSVGAARAVGQALGRNPFALIVPCHRVLAADGSLGGFSAHGGIRVKQRLLAIEGVRLADCGRRRAATDRNSSR